MSESEHKPFWKTPLMWLVIGLPLASIVAGVSLVVIAVRSGGADAVPDEVRRMSQVQTTDLALDEQARARGLSAVVRMADGVVEVIPVTGDFRRQAPLQVLLQHPTRAADDVRIDLAPSDAGWRAELAVDDGHDWIVQLASPEDGWRLHGRLPKQQHATHLSPALAQ